MIDALEITALKMYNDKKAGDTDDFRKKNIFVKTFVLSNANEF